MTISRLCRNFRGSRRSTPASDARELSCKSVAGVGVALCVSPNKEPTTNAPALRRCAEGRGLSCFRRCAPVTIEIAKKASERPVVVCLSVWVWVGVLPRPSIPRHERRESRDSFGNGFQIFLNLVNFSTGAHRVVNSVSPAVELGTSCIKQGSRKSS